MNTRKVAPVFAAITAAVLMNFNGVHAADKDAAKDKDGDARISALENKIQALESRVKDLETQLTERVRKTPFSNFGGGFGGRNGQLNDMLEQLQKEMMNNGLDFNMPDFPQLKGLGGGLNRAPGRKPRLGVELDTVRDELKTQFKNEVKEGAFVMNVVPGSSAEKAGLLVGDAITSFDGKTVSDPQALIEAVKNAAPGPHEIIVSRHSEALALKVDLGAETAVEEPLKLDNEGFLRNGAPDIGGAQMHTELKVSALELNDTTAKDLKLSDEQKKKAGEILAKHQKALSDEFENKGAMKKKSRPGQLQLNITGNLNELAQKHADAAAKELAGVFNEEQMKKWNDYRQSNNSVSFSQSMKTQTFGVPLPKSPVQPNDDNADAKF